MKSPNMSVVMLVVCLFLAPAVGAQAPASGNQSAAPSAPSASTAIVPRLIKFTGTLFDAQTRPMVGPVGVTFALYAQQTGGAALWMETQNVKPDANGEYTVFLGAESSHGVPAELFTTGEARWLGIQMERQTEQERVLLVSVPYALKAADAESLGGLPASAYSLAQPSAPAVSGAPGTSGASGTSATGSGAAPQGSTSKSVTNARPQPAGAIAANFIPVFTSNAGTLGSSVLFQNPSSNFLGVGTATPVSALDLRLTGTGVGDVVSVGNQSGGGRFGVLGFSRGVGAPFIVQGDLNDDLVLGANLSEKMRITSAGNVGIGATAPSSKLTVNGVANQLGVQSSTSGGEASMAFIPGGGVHTWQAGVNTFGPGFFVYENGGGYRLVVKEGGAVNINGSLNLPNTAGPAVGVISLGGVPFAHNYGVLNTFVGQSAGNFTMTGSRNTASGVDALSNNTTGTSNTAIGLDALFNNTTGGVNIAIGSLAGLNATTGDDNIYIGNFGVAAEGNTIRIGSVGNQTNTFIAGISVAGVTGASVLVDSSGHLGVATSSRRFKYDIQDMGEASNDLLRLRPVSFRYKQGQEEGSHPLQFGLIAEEVAEVYPELVQYGEKGEVNTVLYNQLPALLLNEVQKQHGQIEAQERQIETQREQLLVQAAQLADLRARLERLVLQLPSR
jgi:hypothetical protein